VTVTGVDDALADGDIVFTIVTAAATSTDTNYNTLNPADVSVTNTDDETAGFTVVELGGNTETNEDGLSQNFTVVLDAQPETDVVFTITEDDADDSEITLQFTTLTFTTGDWDTPQNVEVVGLNDSPLVDGPQVTIITISVNDALSADPFDGLGDQIISATTLDLDPRFQ